MHSTKTSQAFWVSDFSGNLRAQKINKAQTKRVNKTEGKYFFGICYYACINSSGSNFVSYLTLSLFNFLKICAKSFFLLVLLGEILMRAL